MGVTSAHSGDPAHRETRAGTLRTVARRGFSCWGAQGPFREVTSEGLAVWGRGCAKGQLGQSCVPRKGDPPVGVPGVGSSRGLDKGPAWGSSPEGHTVRRRGRGQCHPNGLEGHPMRSVPEDAGAGASGHVVGWDSGVALPQSQQALGGGIKVTP